jgi:hypothetical protein
MTQKQLEYIKNRASGMGQEQAALKAGYAASSAKVSASRMERMPAIARAINKARKVQMPDSPDALIVFDNPEEYLLAVVQGKVTPDPARVSAARALLPYSAAKQRTPKGKKEERKEKGKSESQDGRFAVPSAPRNLTLVIDNDE